MKFHQSWNNIEIQMTEKEQQMLDLLKRALYDLKEHRDEYHHKGEDGLIEEIQTLIKESQ